MVSINLTKNFKQVFNALTEQQNMNISGIAKSMGYTTSAQLHSVISGTSLLSTKAIMELIINLNVSPNYLFLGVGDIFITDETEVEKLRNENFQWTQRHNEALKTIIELNETVKKLEKRNADLIDISTAAIKYHKEHPEEDTNPEEKK